MFKPGLSLRSGTKIYDAVADDLFSTKTFGDTLLKIILDKDLMKDIRMIALYGSWGSGKTTLSHYLKATSVGSAYIEIFEAWHYEYKDDLALSLFYTISEAMEKKDGIQEQTIKSIEKGFMTILKLIKNVVINTNITIGDPITGAVLELDFPQAYAETTKGDEQLENSTYRSLKLLNELFKKFIEEFIDVDKPLIIIIDDLDRCEPENVLKLLSFVKHFFTHTDRIKFICTIDQEAVKRSINLKYGDTIKSSEYLEKLFDITLNLPVNKSPLYYIMPMVIEDSTNSIADNFSLFLKAIELTNPRQLLKCVNRMQILIEVMFAGEWYKYIFPQGSISDGAQYKSMSYLENKLFHDLLIYFIMLKEYYHEEFNSMLDFELKRLVIESNSKGLQTQAASSSVVDLGAKVPKDNCMCLSLFVQDRHSSTPSSPMLHGSTLDKLHEAYNSLITMLLSPHFSLTSSGTLITSGHSEVQAVINRSRHSPLMKNSACIINALFEMYELRANRFFFKAEYLTNIDLDIYWLYQFVLEH